MIAKGGTTSSYEIVAKLASGGMAEVFLARVTSEVSIERYVVLKRVLPELASDPAFVAMFLDEARLAAQLRHPNIAQLYDVGRLGSSYFYTMEYIHGATAWLMMERALAAQTQIPLAHVLTIAGNISAALHHAHTRVGADRNPLNIVHRDVSPANIMISGEGVVKLLDFGVAKAQGRSTVTKVGMIKGKIAYLSPEQCSPNMAIDGRSDIFSLGICLYELLTLHQLFQRNADLPTMSAIVNEQVPPPSYFRPECPGELDRIVMTALAKDPAQRFATADAMHTAVEDAAATLGIATSVTALARFMSTMFGNPPEPWHALPSTAASAITVIASPIDITQPSPKLEAARDSADLDDKIKKVRAVSQPEGGGFIEESTDVEDLPRSSRPSIPMASAHPNWGATVSGAGSDFSAAMHDALDRTAPEPKSLFEEDVPSDVQTKLDHRAQTGATAPATNLPTERPVVQQRTFPTPPPMRAFEAPPPPQTWNVPRLVIAGALVIAIIVAIVLLSC